MPEMKSNPSESPVDETMRLISPTVTVMAIVAVLGIAVGGVVLGSEAQAPQIFGFCTIALLALLNLLKQDYVVKRIHANDQITAEVKQSLEKKDQEVKQALEVSDKKKEETMSTLVDKMDIVAKQTNGDLTVRLTIIEDKVDRNSEWIKNLQNSLKNRP